MSLVHSPPLLIIIKQPHTSFSTMMIKINHVVLSSEKCQIWKVKNAKYKQMFFYYPCCERGRGGRIFFRKPPAFHRLPFMPPFAGDIGARAGSLKWTAQIPRKAYRWSLGSGSKCCDGVSNVEAEPRERLFLMRAPRKHPSCGP